MSFSEPDSDRAPENVRSRADARGIKKIVFCILAAVDDACVQLQMLILVMHKPGKNSSEQGRLFPQRESVKITSRRENETETMRCVLMCNLQMCLHLKGSFAWQWPNCCHGLRAGAGACPFPCILQSVSPAMQASLCRCSLRPFVLCAPCAPSRFFLWSYTVTRELALASSASLRLSQNKGPALCI